MGQQNLPEIENSTRCVHGVAEKLHDIPISAPAIGPNLLRPDQFKILGCGLDLPGGSHYESEVTKFLVSSILSLG